MLLHSCMLWQDRTVMEDPREKRQAGPTGVHADCLKLLRLNAVWYDEGLWVGRGPSWCSFRGNVVIQITSISVFSVSIGPKNICNSPDMPAQSHTKLSRESIQEDSIRSFFGFCAQRFWKLKTRNAHSCCSVHR